MSYSNIQGLREHVSSGSPHRNSQSHTVVLLRSTPHHSCLFNFPKWLLPSIAGIVTFYPDSKHRTSVNPSAASRLSHVRRKKKQVPGPVRAVKHRFPGIDWYMIFSIWDYFTRFWDFVFTDLLFTFFFHLCLPKMHLWIYSKDDYNLQ